MTPSVAAWIANVVLILHAGIAIFVVGGLLLVIVGNVARWHWINKLWLRLAHLAAIAVVVAESWFGVPCPLTLLEKSLRTRAGVAAYSGGFIEHWVGRLLFYAAPPSVFVFAYSVFGLLVILTWWYFPPKKSYTAPSRTHRPHRKSAGVTL
jgi:hypothetical protein